MNEKIILLLIQIGWQIWKQTVFQILLYFCYKKLKNIRVNSLPFLFYLLPYLIRYFSSKCESCYWYLLWVVNFLICQTMLPILLQTHVKHNSSNYCEYWYRANDNSWFFKFWNVLGTLKIYEDSRGFFCTRNPRVGNYIRWHVDLTVFLVDTILLEVLS